MALYYDIQIIKNGGIITELLKFAFSGANVIPTAFLLLMQAYWIIASLGIFDLEFLDIDIDLDGEIVETSGLLNAVAIFFNIGQVPFMLVLSILSFNFWVMMMFTYYIPIQMGTVLSMILVLPVFILSSLLTKYHVHLLKMSIFEKKSHNNIVHRVLKKQCILMSDLEYGKLGQAEIQEDGPSIVINVMTKVQDVSFHKGDHAFIEEKDKEKNVYYITRLPK